MNTVSVFAKNHAKLCEIDIEHELIKRMKNRGIGVITWIKRYAPRFRKDWNKQYASKGV